MRSWRGVVIGAVAGAVLLGAAGSYALADTLTAPARAAVGPPPDDLGAESVAIPSGSGSTLAGWFVRGMVGQGAVLLLHQLRGNRSSMIGRARFLRDAGYSVLLVDLQAHGESPGDRITFGAQESLDARAALGYLMRAAPGENIGAIGVSLGGASLLLGAGDPAGNLARAIVLEAVYPAIEKAIANRLRLRAGSVGPMFTPMLAGWLRPLTGVESAELRPVERISSVVVPVMVIAGSRDRHTTVEDSRHLFEAARAPKAFRMIEGAAHEDLHTFGGGEYERAVLEFLEAHLRQGGGGNRPFR